jgi:hypothetical protein
MDSAQFIRNFKSNDKGQRPYENQPLMLQVRYDPNSIPNQFAKLQGLERTIAINYLHGKTEILSSLINSLICSLQGGVGLPNTSNLPTIAERIKQSIDKTLNNLQLFLYHIYATDPQNKNAITKFLGLDTDTPVTTQP